MKRYALKRLFLTCAIAVPAPAALARLCRLYHDARAGENFGDITINGELRFLREGARAGDVLFDVGAHHGEWTCHALDSIDGARVHCFEPLASNHRVLQSTCGSRNVVCNDFGLSDQQTTGMMDVASCSLHRRTRDSGAAVEKVRLRTLDGYCREHGIAHIDFLKIDVEGHELAVLRGARQMLAGGRVARVQFEYGPCNADSRVLLRDLFSFFEALDYDLFKVTPRHLLPVAYDRALENLQYKNFAAVHHSQKR